MWKLYHEELSQNIENVFIRHNKNQVSRTNFISHYRANYKERFITNTGPLVWNDLPGFLKQLKSCKLFSKKIKSHLLEIK